MHAKIVVIEGADQVGKETLSKRLVDELTRAGLRVIRVEATKAAHPAGKKLIYSMLESGAAKRHPHLFQFVQFVNRMYFQLFKLPKLTRDREIIFLDRWALSGFVYGKCEGINARLNKFMFSCAKKADLTLVIWGTSYRRVTADDSYEKDIDLQRRVKKEYLSAANAFHGHELVNNERSLDDITESVLHLLRLRGIISRNTWMKIMEITE